MELIFSTHPLTPKIAPSIETANNYSIYVHMYVRMSPHIKNFLYSPPPIILGREEGTTSFNPSLVWASWGFPHTKQLPLIIMATITKYAEKVEELGEIVGKVEDFIPKDGSLYLSHSNLLKLDKRVLVQCFNNDKTEVTKLFCSGPVSELLRNKTISISNLALFSVQEKETKDGATILSIGMPANTSGTEIAKKDVKGKEWTPPVVEHDDLVTF